jgi:RND family efflux transporter MFP subunit
MSKKAIIIPAVVIGAILLGLLVWRWDQMQAVTTSAQVLDSLSVETDIATIGPMKEMIVYSGTIRAASEVTVTAQTSGIIIKTTMEIGRRYTSGEVLAVVENDLQKAALEQAEAQKLLADANYAKAQSDLKRLRSLRADSIVTQSDIETMELAFQTALAQVKSASAALTIAGKQFNDAFIKARIRGILVSKKADLGASIAPGFELGVIIDDSRLLMNIMVSETDIIKVKSGQKARIRADAAPGREFAGQVRSIGAAATDGRAFPVEIELTEAISGDLFSGMFARCAITVGTKDSALGVAQRAIVQEPDGKASVFTIDNGIAKKVKVVLGLKSGSRWEIKTGLEPGRQVVTEGKERLKDGAKVRKASKIP